MYNSIILLISITSGFLMILVYTSINLSVFINLSICHSIDNIWKMSNCLPLENTTFIVDVCQPLTIATPNTSKNTDCWYNVYKVDCNTTIKVTYEKPEELTKYEEFTNCMNTTNSRISSMITSLAMMTVISSIGAIIPFVVILFRKNENIQNTNS